MILHLPAQWGHRQKALPRRCASQALRLGFVALWSNGRAECPIVRPRRGSADVPYAPSVSSHPVRRFPGADQQAGHARCAIFSLLYRPARKTGESRAIFSILYLRTSPSRPTTQPPAAVTCVFPAQRPDTFEAAISGRHPLSSEGYELEKKDARARSHADGRYKSEKIARDSTPKAHSRYKSEKIAQQPCEQRASLPRRPYRNSGSPAPPTARSPRNQPEGCRLF